MRMAADLFCGAGGTTTGMLRAAARSGVKLDMLAVNHWNLAIDTHTLNHPDVRHLCESLDGVDPRKVIPGGKLSILAASPECTHHSIARGGRPMSDQSRASAWHVVRWAEAVTPDFIVIENVKEFQQWGPLTRKGKALKSRKGETFLALLQAFDSLGYRVDHQLLNAADFGDATSRTRLFVQAWKRRRPTWPDASHAGHWKPAREVIDWGMKGQSILQRKKPLSANTMRRIVAGLKKFSGLPFVMPIDHLANKDAGAASVEKPLSTITTEARHALAEPWLINLRGTKPQQLDNTAQSTHRPLPTFTASGGHLGLCEALLIGQQSCAAARPVSEPMPTISTSGAIALAEPFLTKFYGTGGASSIHQPLDTITTKDRFGLCMPSVEIDGETYVVDVLFRMLQPYELKQAMGFGMDYLFAGNKGDQVKQIGNAVSVATAEALFMNIMSKGGRGRG